MTASLTSVPSHALLCWIDDTAIYVAIPSTDPKQPPYVSKFPKHEQGLSKALNLLRVKWDEVPSAMKNYTVKSREPTVVNGKPPVQSAAQRDAALAILRKLRIV
jgi:hypothetical protein